MTLSSRSAAESQHQSVAVHALNILRALFEDSRLGVTIVPFIPDGVMIAIEGFAAVFWPVRDKTSDKMPTRRNEIPSLFHSRVVKHELLGEIEGKN